MPAKNRIKQYIESGCYHIYNRGTEKKPIFLDQQDYSVFLSYLRQYLLPQNTEELSKVLSNPSASWREKNKARQLLRLNNFADDITLLAYCLMPNHFHFLLKQKNSGSIDKFLNSLGTRYTIYFNKKYKRVGPLYQGVYKAVLVTHDEQFIYLTKYIHKQALNSYHLAGQDWLFSYPEYLGQRKREWVHPEEILGFFSKNHPSLSYKAFVEDRDEGLELIGPLLLENDF